MTAFILALSVPGCPYSDTLLLSDSACKATQFFTVYWAIGKSWLPGLNPWPFGNEATEQTTWPPALGIMNLFKNGPILMLRLKPRISGVRSNCSSNSAITTALQLIRHTEHFIRSAPLMTLFSNASSQSWCWSTVSSFRPKNWVPAKNLLMKEKSWNKNKNSVEKLLSRKTRLEVEVAKNWEIRESADQSSLRMEFKIFLPQWR